MFEETGKGGRNDNSSMLAGIIAQGDSRGKRNLTSLITKLQSFSVG
jgi:hypothetical protein